MTGRPLAARVAVSVLLLTLTIMAAVVTLAVFQGTLTLEDLGWMAAWMPMSLVGTVIAARRPANPLGWIYASAPLAIAGGLAIGLAAVEPLIWAALLSQTLAIIGIAGLGLFALVLFPTGSLPSGRWSWYPPTAVIAVATLVLARALEHDVGLTGVSVSNPLPLAGHPVATGAAVISGATVFLLGLCGAMSVLVRFRRVALDERRQLKWLALVLSAAMVAFVASALAEVLEARPLFVDLTAQAFYLILGVGVPAAIGVSILRYRLYEIDRIISRTVSYGLLTTLLVGVYVVGVLGLGTVARSLGGEPNDALAVAASTLVVVALFGPARRRLQALIDRRFNRARYDAERTVELFGRWLRNVTDVDDLWPELQAVATRAVQPASSSLWLSRGPR